MKRLFPALVLCGSLMVLAGALSQAQEKGPRDPAAKKQEPIDFNKARELLRKQRGGGTLTDEEKAYLDRARAARRAGQKNRPQPKGGADKLDLVPLTALKETYKGQDGGLYGKGSNAPPQKHLDAALRQAALIKPLDADGKPSPNGRVVMVSIGMSNTTQEFSAFVRLARSQLNPHLLLVDCAQGGQAGAEWAKPGQATNRKRAGDPWEEMDRRLKQAGVSPAQVQVLWMKQAEKGPGRLGEFPKHAEELKNNEATILTKARQKFPNLRLAYLSSRIYAGYAASTLNPEPYAYESAFSVRWLIQDQLAGKPEFNYDPERGAVKMPLVLWGPYLWTNGTAGRAIDDVKFSREDLAGDGTHPSESGRQKVAQMLLTFFLNDPTTREWFAAGKK